MFAFIFIGMFRYLRYLLLSVFLLVFCFGTGAQGTGIWKKRLSQILVIKRKDDTISQKNVIAKATDTSLADLMINAVKQSKLRAYRDPNTFLDTISLAQFKDIFGIKFDTVQIQPIAASDTTIITEKQITGESVSSFSVLEEWTFDPLNGKTSIQILSISPRFSTYRDDGEYLGEHSIFWVQYKDVLPILIRHKFSAMNDDLLTLLWDDYFNVNIKSWGNSPHFPLPPDLTDEYVLGRKAVAKTSFQKVFDKERNAFHDEDTSSPISAYIISAMFEKYIKAYEPIDYFLAKQKSVVEIRDSLYQYGRGDNYVFPDTSHKYDRTFIAYSFLEDWKYDILKGKVEINVLAISPLQDEHTEGELITPYPLFWIKYSDIKQVLNNYALYHPYDNIISRQWDEYFKVSEAPMKEQK